MTKIEEMVEGYLDGLESGSVEYPECHKNRSSAYKHGWVNGMSDRLGQPTERADVLRRRANMILGET